MIFSFFYLCRPPFFLSFVSLYFFLVTCGSHLSDLSSFSVFFSVSRPAPQSNYRIVLDRRTAEVLDERMSFIGGPAADGFLSDINFRVNAVRSFIARLFPSRRTRSKFPTCHGISPGRQDFRRRSSGFPPVLKLLVAYWSRFKSNFFP